MKEITVLQVINETGRHLTAEMFNLKIYAALKTAQLFGYNIYNKTTKEFLSLEITSGVTDLIYKMYLGHGVAHLTFKKN